MRSDSVWSRKTIANLRASALEPVGAVEAAAPGGVVVASAAGRRGSARASGHGQSRQRTGKDGLVGDGPPHTGLQSAGG